MSLLPKTIYAATLLILAVGICGCGESLPSMAEMNDTNIQRLHSCYRIYMRSHEAVGPKNESEFKEFLKTDQTAKVLLERMEVLPENVEDIFVSERDNKPFEINWELKGLRKDHAIVSESEGVEGKRMVAFSQPREIETSNFDEIWNGAAAKTAKEEPTHSDINSSLFNRTE